MVESNILSGKILSQQAYSVKSILEKTDDDYAIDLSLKQVATKLDSDTIATGHTVKPNESLGTNFNSEKINQMFLNLIQQREITKRFHSPSGDPSMHQNRCGYDKGSKMYNGPPGMPWNFLRPNQNHSGSNLFHQFQNIIFNKKNPNPPLMPGSLCARPNFKTFFSQTNSAPHVDNSSNYFHNLSQIFNSRLNVTQNIDNAPYLSIGADNFSAKHFPASNIDLSPHFNLQNILKSTSNRKRKRTKVTDTRLPRRATTHQAYSHSYSQIPPNPIVAELPRFQSFIQSPSNSSQSSHSEEAHGDPKKYTLTPIHLRKAKLMFLYTRYPNSQMLKSYFPDITFCKQNTAQLVKWFSNFREFYYSEMEKAVQRALSNGTQYAKDIDVTVDSELFKNLMTHFNKKKQIVVPCEFLTTVQITLREFFDAISTGKNLHQSWKKPIYKNIAKLDQPLPEFFKDMNWMMELAKDENENISN